MIGFYKKKILAFRVFHQPHTPIFEEFKIDNKIFAISFDNASNNTTAISYLINLCNSYFVGKFFHQKCSCHVLNL